MALRNLLPLKRTLGRFYDVVFSFLIGSYRPSARKVGLFGDSRAFMSYSSSGYYTDFLKGWGIAHWIQYLSNGACCFPYVLNGGVAGDTTGGMLKRLPAYIATMKAEGANLVIIQMGGNDRTAGIDLQTSCLNTQRIVRAFQDAQIAVILCNGSARGNGSSAYDLNPAQTADHFAWHQFVDRVMSQECQVVDTWTRSVDPASGTKYWARADMVRDGVHHSKIGAYQDARSIVKVIDPFLHDYGLVPTSNQLYDANNNPLGPLAPNALMTGTGGTIPAKLNPTPGSVLATGWNADGGNMTGLQSEWSKEIDEQNVEWQKVRVFGTSGASAGEIVLQNNVTLGYLADGDKLRAVGLVKTRGVGLSFIGLGLLEAKSYRQKLDGDDPDPSLPYPEEAISGRMETPVATWVVADATPALVVRPTVSIRPNSTVDFTFWITRCTANKTL